jgi:hypothetical protein
MKTKNRFKRWIVCSTALVSFAAGFMVVGVTHADEMKLDSNRVFELLIYHTRPVKAPALESIFRDASMVMAGSYQSAPRKTIFIPTMKDTKQWQIQLT